MQGTFILPKKESMQMLRPEIAFVAREDGAARHAIVDEFGGQLGAMGILNIQEKVH